MNFRRFFFLLSLLINILLAGSLFFVVHRLGGLNFALHRIVQDEAGLYSHRKQLFELLPPNEQAIVFLGDSQTEQCEWRELFGGQLMIINRGIVADHVAGIEGRLDKIVSENPRLLFLQVGINDLIQKASVEETAAKYEHLVAEIRQKTPQAQLVLQSVFPVNNGVKWIGVENETVKALNLELKKIAKKYALPYVDIFKVLTDAEGDLHSQFTEDGIHLNGKGYAVWKNALNPFINNVE